MLRIAVSGKVNEMNEDLDDIDFENITPEQVCDCLLQFSTFPLLIFYL